MDKITIPEHHIVLNNKKILSVPEIGIKNKIYHISGRNGSGKSVFLSDVYRYCSKEGLNVLYLQDVPIGEPGLTIRENCILQHLFFSVPLSESLSQMIEIEDQETLYEQASLGTQMKVGLSLLMVFDHWDLILLDETLANVDLRTQVILYKVLQKQAYAGTAVLLAMHQLSAGWDIEHIWSIEGGRIHEKS